MLNKKQNEGIKLTTNRHIKKLHRISNHTFVIIDENLVQALKIDEETWVEEVLTHQGILLRIQGDPGG
jgi:hypothetical protein